MSDFSYELPNEDGFFNAVMTVLGNDPKYSNNKDHQKWKIAENKAFSAIFIGSPSMYSV